MAELATAFYSVLSVGLDAVTPASRRRDLVIARDLLAVGAITDAAAANAHDTAAAHGRIAPLDQRGFERERLGLAGPQTSTGLRAARSESIAPASRSPQIEAPSSGEVRGAFH